MREWSTVCRGLSSKLVLLLAWAVLLGPLRMGAKGFVQAPARFLRAARVIRPCCRHWSHRRGGTAGTLRQQLTCSLYRQRYYGSKVAVETPPGPLPITLVSGFVGSGKKSLVRHILENKPRSMRVAVLTEDLEALSIDRDDINDRAYGDEESMIEEVIELVGGSVCCLVSPEVLVDAVLEVSAMKRFDCVLIENSEVTEPMQVAQTLVEELEGEDVVVDTLVTVVDTSTFLSEWNAAEFLEDRGLSADEFDDRTATDVLVSQVEYANVILLNKEDLAKRGEHERLEAMLRVLNPDAKILKTKSCKVEVSEVVKTGLFDMERAEVPGWLRLLDQHHGDSSEGQQAAEDKADSSTGPRVVVFRARRPFHPERLWSFIHEDMRSVVRSRGFFWLATRNDAMGLWSQAGGSFAAESGGAWWAATDRDLWPEDPEDIESILADFVDDPMVGDRRQELVLIGRENRRGFWARQLNKCLLRDEEVGMPLSDPFPRWEVEDDDDHDHDHDHH